MPSYFYEWLRVLDCGRAVFSIVWADCTIFAPKVCQICYFTESRYDVIIVLQGKEKRGIQYERF